MTWLASQTKRIRFGPLVAPFSIREPHLLVRQATAIDDLSGGRLVLGVGAGWMEREHRMFGHALGDIPTRMARFEEGLHYRRTSFCKICASSLAARSSAHPKR